MELRQLEYFVATADHGNFTRAAERLFVVQSAVSSAIKSLEHEVGAALFLRSSKRMELTVAGAAFLPRARTTLHAAQSARDAVDAVQGGVHGTVRLGTMRLGSPWSDRLIDVPAVLGRFHTTYPDVALHLASTMTGSLRQAQAVAVGTLDLALVSLAGPAPKGVHLQPLATSAIDLVVPPGHRLSGRRTVPITDLGDEDFIDFPTGFGNRVITDRAFAAAGVQRRVVIEISDGTMGTDYVRAGLGVALLPRFVAPVGLDTTTVRITGAELGWAVALATPTTRSLGVAAAALEGMIVAAAGNG